MSINLIMFWTLKKVLKCHQATISIRQRMYEHIPVEPVSCPSRSGQANLCYHV